MDSTLMNINKSKSTRNAKGTHQQGIKTTYYTTAVFSFNPTRKYKAVNLIFIRAFVNW